VKTKQWDLVDNAIFDLIEELNPSVETKIEWTTDGVAEARAEIRETLTRLYCEGLKLCTEQEFYPYEEYEEPTEEEQAESAAEKRKRYICKNCGSEFITKFTQTKCAYCLGELEDAGYVG